MQPGQEDSLELGPAPGDFPHESAAETFPREWKDVAWRRLSRGTGEWCPLCERVLTHNEFADIHMDHFWPRSLMGDSAWSNLRLLCSTWRLFAVRTLSSQISRGVLATKAFRALVSGFLREAVVVGALAESPFLQELLAREDQTPGEAGRESPQEGSLLRLTSPLRPTTNE